MMNNIKGVFWEVFQVWLKVLGRCFKGAREHLRSVSRVTKNIWEVFSG